MDCMITQTAKYVEIPIVGEVSVVVQWHYYDIDRSPSFLTVQWWYRLKIAIIEGFDFMILNPKIISADFVGRLIPEYSCSHQYYLQFQSIHELHDCVLTFKVFSFRLFRVLAFVLEGHLLSVGEGMLCKVRKWV